MQNPEYAPDFKAMVEFYFILYSISKFAEFTQEQRISDIVFFIVFLYVYVNIILYHCLLCILNLLTALYILLYVLYGG